MPRRKTFNKVNNDNVKIAHGRKARPKNKRVVPRKFEKPKTDNSFKQTLRQHVTVNVGGKDTEAEPKITKEQAQALIPRVQLARQLPSPEAGYNLFSALADKREAELKGLARHLEMLKGGTAYSRPQPTGKELTDSLKEKPSGGLGDLVTPRTKARDDLQSLYQVKESLKAFLIDNVDKMYRSGKPLTLNQQKKEKEKIDRLVSDISIAQRVESILAELRDRGVQPDYGDMTPVDLERYVREIRGDMDRLSKEGASKSLLFGSPDASGGGGSS
jgi:hypothetical protein